MILKLFLFFFKTSLFTLGGGYVMIIAIERKITEKKWLSDSEFLEILSIAQAIPGAIIFNVAFLTGKKLCGYRGAFVSILGVILPPFIVLSFIAAFINTISDYQPVQYFLKGVYAASIGMIINLLLKMHKNIHWTLLKFILILSGLVLSIINQSFIIPVFIGLTILLYVTGSSHTKKEKI
ncbi:MAG: hypothetical protein A2015_07795 [Spirochaetes bacterium GWF1_31_7]|nr:MAG: hypothetical protein A2Y30_01890 [Spirochaetes bacterium GWE1_32_154]OHD46944.1 MAG: hypothetical protein A2015_07795 [Spirochaetes bacterium GWF1_31_7]OHD48722.1 MAG: hypothetical protein A2Y29_14025 [Spirochaetes bacterium GWE2_31_10]OHD82340.1 MAG: hypothetical protein A2355_11945 [Spirochaetes bacterium RIFOXYB1_FULL_32_8]HBD95549.1 chromate transporter [Spirochaetia bacterium]